MSLIAFDNRNLEYGLYSNVDVETASGLFSYINLTRRMIYHLYGISREVLSDDIFGIFLPNPDVGVRFEEWKGMKFSTLLEILNTQCSLITSSQALSDSWGGFLTSIVRTIKGKQSLFSKKKELQVTIFTHDVALYGFTHQRCFDEENVLAFATSLKELREVINVNIKIFCINISGDHDTEFVRVLHTLILKSENFIRRESENLTTCHETKGFCIICTENNSLYFEAILREIVQNCRPLILSRLHLPKTSSFEASIDVELAPCTLQSLNQIQSGQMESLQLIGSCAIDATNIDGFAMLMRPATLQNHKRSRNNQLLFLALARMLRKRDTLLMVRTKFRLPSDLHTILNETIPTKRGYHEISEINGENDFLFHQYWVVVPMNEEMCQMTLVKLVDSEDILQVFYFVICIHF